MITLVLGGIKSGKSAYAVQRARESTVPVTVVAPGVAHDEEMQLRIEAHKLHRPQDWIVIETLDPKAFTTIGKKATILLDSVDTVLFNLLEKAGGADALISVAQYETIVDECCRVVVALERNNTTTVIAVSNEVGLSLVAATRYGRVFTDLLGLINQKIAQRADEVVMIIAGIPLPLQQYRQQVQKQ